MEKRDDMFVNQLSVFIENREGRLEQVLEILKNNNIYNYPYLRNIE